MNSFWQKVRADLVEHKSRTLLAISSMAIGLFVLGTLLGMIDLQLNKMDAAHQASQPSHISFILKSEADLSVAEPIKSIAGVANIDLLTQFTVRFRTPSNPQWQTGTALFRPDYQQQQYDLMTLSSGNWPTDKTVAVERLSAKFSNLNQNDRIEFETEKNNNALTVGGIIRHPFVKPPPFGGQLHFFIAPESAAVFGIKPNSFRQLLVQVTQPYSEEKARTIAGDIRVKLATLGIGVNATLLQNPEKHWGRPFFFGINLILTVMAWASLALSAVLILNTLAAIITQQTDQIGIMKSMGGRRVTIAGIYLKFVMILALIAIIVAVPCSLLAAFLSSRWLLDLFNIELNAFVYSPRALWLMVVGGLLTPLLASLWPITRGATMTVRQAIASYGLGADFSSHRIDRWLETRAFTAIPVRYAVILSHLFGHKTRLLWTQSVLIIAGVLFIVIVSLIESVNLTLDNELARSRYDVRMGFSRDQPKATVDHIARTVSTTHGVEFWNRYPAELTWKHKLLQQTGSLGAQVVALPVDTKLYKPLITAGRWFETQDNDQKVVVVNAETAEQNGIQVGDTVHVNLQQRFDSEWLVIGMYRWFVGSGYAVEPVYVPLRTAQGITHQSDYASFALLTADVSTLAEEKKYTDILKQLFQDQHIKLDFYTTIAKREQRQFAKNQFRPVTLMLLGLAILIAAVGAIGLTGTMAISVLQRTREIGVFRAIGARSSTIFSLFILEGLFHGLLAWLASLPIAYRVAEPLSRQLGKLMLGIQLDFTFSLIAVWIWLGLVTVLVLVATYFPARQATQIAVRSSLNY